MFTDGYVSSQKRKQKGHIIMCYAKPGSRCSGHLAKKMAAARSDLLSAGSVVDNLSHGSDVSEKSLYAAQDRYDRAVRTVNALTGEILETKEGLRVQRQAIADGNVNSMPAYLHHQAIADVRARSVKADKVIREKGADSSTFLSPIRSRKSSKVGWDDGRQYNVETYSDGGKTYMSSTTEASQVGDDPNTRLHEEELITFGKGERGLNSPVKSASYISSVTSPSGTTTAILDALNGHLETTTGSRSIRPYEISPVIDDPNDFVEKGTFGYKVSSRSGHVPSDDEKAAITSSLKAGGARSVSFSDAS